MNPTFDPNDLMNSGLHMQPGLALIVAVVLALLIARPWKGKG